MDNIITGIGDNVVCPGISLYFPRGPLQLGEYAGRNVLIIYDLSLRIFSLLVSFNLLHLLISLVYDDFKFSLVAIVFI